MLHKRIIGRMVHVGGGMDEGLLALDLMVDRGDEIVTLHVC